MRLNLLSTLSAFLLCAPILIFSQSQENISVVNPAGLQQANAASISPSALSINKNTMVPAQQTMAKPPLTNCSDKINYVGNTVTGAFKLGGSNGFSGVYQVFPAYYGKVIGVEYIAAKYPGSSPTMSIAITNANSGGYPGSSYAGIPQPVVITSTAITTYTLFFPTPVTVSGAYGFGVAFYNYETTADSAKFYRGPVKSGFNPDYSFLTDQSATSYTSVNTYFGQDIDFLFRPIVQTSVNPTWVSARTSTGCALPAVYDFTASGVTPGYVNDNVINPLGVDHTVDFGDGGGPAPLGSSIVTHSYTTLGTFIAKYEQTYNGWTNNCVGTSSISILVDNPIPAFTYTANGLTINITNTSGSNFTSFIWNFGDLTTSNQQQPGIHTFSSPGTYVIELEGTAPCGKVKYTLTVTVSASTVGVDENINAASKIVLYPNPAGNILHLYNSGPQLNSKVEIYDIYGRLVLNSINEGLFKGEASIDISALERGVYFVKLQNMHGDMTRNFIRQ